MGKKKKSHDSFKGANKAYIYGYVVTLTLGSFQMGYSMAEINFPDLQRSQLPSSPLLVPFGALFGSLLGSLFVGNGRRKTLLLTNIFVILGFALKFCSFMLYWEEFILETENLFIIMFSLGRFIQGISTGIFSMMIPITKKEITSEMFRGKLGTIHQLMTNHPDNDYGFAIFITLGISFIQTFLFIFLYKYETPKFYIMKNKPDLAFRALKKLFSSIQDIVHEQLILEESKNESKFQTKCKALCSYDYKRAIFAGSILSVLQQLSVVNVVVLYSSKIFIKISGKSSDAVYMSLILGGISVISCYAIAFFFIDRAGRKILLLAGSIQMVIGLILMAIFFQTHNNLVFLISSCIFTFGYQYSIGPVTWVYIPEIMPVIGVGFSLSLNRFFAIVTTFPFYIDKDFEYTYIEFLVGGFFMILCFFYCLCYLRKTQFKSEMEIKSLFDSINQSRYRDDESFLSS